jgi:hypothetical protein
MDGRRPVTLATPTPNVSVAGNLSFRHLVKERRAKERIGSVIKLQRPTPSFGERGPFFTSFSMPLTFRCRRSYCLSAIAARTAGTAGVLTAATGLIAAIALLIHVLGTLALVSLTGVPLTGVPLLGVLAGTALLRGILVAASAAAGILSLL